MRTMKKHDFHQVLERAEEVAILLQHRIARQTDQLLQVSHLYSNLPEDNNENPFHSIFNEIREARNIKSDSNDEDATSTDKTGLRSDVSEMTLPELHHET